MPSKASVAFDSTTVSTYSENQTETRYGYNKSGDGLKTIKLLTQYCVETGQPVAYSRQPGDIPDVISVINASSQLAVLGMDKPMLVMDGGYYSESNICHLVREHQKFLLRGQVDAKWICPELDKRMETVKTIGNACPFEPGTYGFRVTVKRKFQWIRERSHGNAAKGDKVTETHRIYLYFYLNTARADCEAAGLTDDIRQVAESIKSGIKLSVPEEKLARKYITVRNTRRGISVS